MFKGKFSKKNNKNYEDIHHSCTIRFLDDSEPITVTFQKDTLGQTLIDHVCNELNLVEKDYFGLRYVDGEKQRHWLEPLKTVYRQLKNVSPVVLCFRVKFYPTEPMKLKEEITRYFLFLQLRRDLHHGRLLCSPADANTLAAYIIQAEVGDYEPEDHEPGYVAQFKMLPKQTQKQEEKIAEIHKTLVGQVPSEAEGNFLKKCCSLDTYGVDPHPVKSLSDYIYLPSFMKPKLSAEDYACSRDQKGNQMYLGVTHLGIVTFQGNKRTHLFKWPQINKIAFEGKMFIVHVTISEGEENSRNFKRKKHACGFKCPTFSACKHLWKCAIEQQYFFTLQNAKEAPKITTGGGFFTRGSKFRFSGRCQKEVYDESSRIEREAPSFVRSASNPQFVRSYNQMRSTSMPNKLKDKANTIEEAKPQPAVDSPRSDHYKTLAQGVAFVVERNHISHSTTDLPNPDVLPEDITLGELPEETPVKVADVPYEPITSPESEALPPFPKLDDKPIDLDTQIQELQNELEKCRAETNHVNEELDPNNVPVEIAEEIYAVKAPTAEEQTPVKSNDITEQLPVEKKQKKSKLAVACKAMTFLMFFVFISMLVMAMLVLESEMDLPVVKDIRGFPQVQDFKQQHYMPVRSTMVQKVGGWFKT